MTDLDRLLLEQIPTGRFGRPPATERPAAIPKPRPPGDPAPDPDAARHRAQLATALRAA